MRFLIPIIISLIGIGVLGMVQYSYATSYPLIMVQYSESCVHLLAGHYKTDCPTLDKLIPYDTSNQFWSGHFIDINGTWVRAKAASTWHYLWYNPSNGSKVCVDCRFPELTDAFQKIIIEPHGFVWIDKLQGSLNGGNLTQYTGRYMQGCTTATIGYSPFVLNDTISYMKSGCTVTNLNTTSIIPVKHTPTDFTSSMIYKYQQWKLAAKNASHGNCIWIKCALPPDPFKNSRW